METIEHKLCADWPLLPPERRRRGRRVVSQAQRRIGWHYLGWVDPERVRLVNCIIGMIDSPWAHVFGNPNAMLYQPLFYKVRIIRFPESAAVILPSLGLSSTN